MAFGVLLIGLWPAPAHAFGLGSRPQVSFHRMAAISKEIPIVEDPGVIGVGLERTDSSRGETLSSRFEKFLNHAGFLLACSLCTSSLFGATGAVPLTAAWAAESRVVGQLQGSGLVFKDTLRIESFEDPKVRGVTLYISNFERPLTEKLSSASNFFSDPSYASVACARTGPVSVADNINTSLQGEQVFEESRSLLFKSLRVQRIYDRERQTLVYASFNTRLDKNDDANKSRFKSSLCAVSLYEEPAPAAVAFPSVEAP